MLGLELILIPLLAFPTGVGLGVTPIMFERVAGRVTGLIAFIAWSVAAAGSVYRGYLALTWVDPLLSDEDLQSCIWCGLAELYSKAIGATQASLGLGIALGLWLAKWRPRKSRSKSARDVVLETIRSRDSA